MLSLLSIVKNLTRKYVLTGFHAFWMPSIIVRWNLFGTASSILLFFVQVKTKFSAQLFFCVENIEKNRWK